MKAILLLEGFQLVKDQTSIIFTKNYLEQKISNLYGIEIHETTINIKSFYDEEIREKLINIILREKPISNVNLNIKDSFFSLCTSRSNKLDQYHYSANEEESTCNII